jgi:hypothetical protein
MTYRTPYDHMMALKNNKVLFSYMETDCSIKVFEDPNDWVIVGKSKEGELNIMPLVNNLFRISIPIEAPLFVQPPMLGDILIGLQPTIEGLITITRSKGLTYFNYNFDFDPYNIETLDSGLTLFLRERLEIKEGFDYLIEDFNRLQSMQAPADQKVQGEDLNSLWNVMGEIDDMLDSEDDLGPTE